MSEYACEPGYISHDWNYAYIPPPDVMNKYDMEAVATNYIAYRRVHGTDTALNFVAL